MKAISRAVLANHPILALVLVVLRWFAWFLVGHPVGTGLMLCILVQETAPIYLLAVAGVVDGMCIFVASRLVTPLSGRYWLWVQAARFRRRWPSVCADLGIGDRRRHAMALSTNFYSSPQGLRPILAAPRLWLLPRFSSVDTVIWSVKPWGERRLDELDLQIVRICDADDGLLEVRLEESRSVRSRWRLVVVFTSRGNRHRRRHTGKKATTSRLEC